MPAWSRGVVGQSRTKDSKICIRLRSAPRLQRYYKGIHNNTYCCFGISFKWKALPHRGDKESSKKCIPTDMFIALEMPGILGYTITWNECLTCLPHRIRRLPGIVSAFLSSLRTREWALDKRDNKSEFFRTARLRRQTGIEQASKRKQYCTCLGTWTLRY